MKLSDYQAGRDQFGRKFPIKIVFNEGRTVYGHVVSYMETGDTTKNILFKLIGNLNNWCNNIKDENTEIIKFDDDVIAEISFFKDY